MFTTVANLPKGENTELKSALVIISVDPALPFSFLKLIQHKTTEDVLIFRPLYYFLITIHTILKIRIYSIHRICRK